MPPLGKSVRHHLERIVKTARDVAEEGAKVTLEQLSVGESAPFSPFE